MKIAFDAQLFLKGNKTGIGWCADNIVRNIAKEGYYECQLNCFTFKYDKSNLENVLQYENEGIKINKCSWFHDAIYKLLSVMLPIPYSFFFGQDADITQFFNFVIPPGVKGKKVTIIHDMAYKAYPETVRLKTKLWLMLTVKQSCRRADKIITVSEFSKNEIIKYLGVPEDKIVVMPNGVDLSIYNTNYSLNKVEEVKNKLGITEKYILYLGTLEPRKNIVRLICAYAELVKRNKNAPKLVIAGRKGWMYDEVFKMVSKEKLENNIIFTGYVNSSDIPILLFGAEVFLFPSLYEGFGMPVIEAMACGTPVITSNTSSLPEVVKDAGILIDPLSEHSICEAIEILLYNENLRQEMINKGLELVKQYSWKNSIRILNKVYAELLNIH